MEGEATYERDIIFGRCKVDRGISRTEKLNRSVWRVLCQGERKPIHAPELAQELMVVFPMEDNSWSKPKL